MKDAGYGVRDKRSRQALRGAHDMLLITQNQQDVITPPAKVAAERWLNW
jgi:hypothetical protein